MLPQSLSSEEFACQARDAGLIPGSGIFPGEGNGWATPVFLPEKFHTQRTWWTVVHGVSNNRTQLGEWARCIAAAFIGSKTIEARQPGIQMLICSLTPGFHAQFPNLFKVIKVCWMATCIEMAVKIFPEVLLGRSFNIFCLDNPTRVRGRSGTLKSLPE